MEGWAEVSVEFLLGFDFVLEFEASGGFVGLVSRKHV